MSRQTTRTPWLGAWALSGSLLALTLWPGGPATAQVTSETLLQAGQSWDGTAYESYPSGTPQLTLLRLTIPAHSTLPWHVHPMPNAAYVMSGTLTVETRSGKQRRITSGDVLAESVDVVHRGATEDEEVVLLVFYAGTPGMALSEAAP